MEAAASMKSSLPFTSAPESADSRRAKWVFGGGENLRKANVQHEDYAIRTRRMKEAEKAEKIMHLICWGPTK